MSSSLGVAAGAARRGALPLHAPAAPGQGWPPQCFRVLGICKLTYGLGKLVHQIMSGKGEVCHTASHMHLFDRSQHEHGKGLCAFKPCRGCKVSHMVHCQG